MAVSSISTLDRDPELLEIADRESLRELCNHLAGLLGTGIALYDRSGEEVVPPAPVPEYCALRAQSFGEKERCLDTKSNVSKPLDEEQRLQVRGCFTGFKYLALEVRNNLEPVATVVIGPYADESTAVSLDPPEGANPEQRSRLSVLHQTVRRLSPSEVERLGRFVGGTLELFLFASLKAWLTSKVHLESVHESFRELQGKNRELRASYEKLKQLDVLKSNFLATVSHELRTPLTSIIGYGEMVLDGIGGKVPPGAKKQVSQIVAKSEQLLQLINSILDLSKIESGRMELIPDRVRLKEVVADALGSVTPQAKKKELKLVSRIADDVPELIADKYKLRQVLVNLLSNAVKFTPENGTVKISSRRNGRGPDSTVVIQVTDSGIGIPPDLHEKIFERFYQVDNSSTRSHGGTGLGLPIVRSFVELHGGTIRVESEPGKGTTMIVELPLTPGRPAAQTD